jgi:signal peptidase II
MLIWLLFTLLLACDQLTKWLAAIYLQNSMEIIPGFLSLSYAENPGIAFSLPIPNMVMIFITPLLLASLVWIIAKSFNLRQKTTRIALCLVLAGGIGNLLNRITLGAVIDFINFSFWPSFNLADTYLTIGVFLFIVFYGRMNKVKV